MQSTQVENAVLVIPAADWQRWQAAKAKATAAEKEAKAIAEEIGIPTAEQIASRLGLKEGEKGEIVVHDGNSQPQGKVSVFRHPGATIPAGWRARFS